MFKKIFPFFLLNCSLACTPHRESLFIKPIVIERSPSAMGFDNFRNHVIEIVTQERDENPTQAIALDFNYQLIRFFNRLDMTSGTAKALWILKLNNLSIELAKYPNVHGIRLIYQDLNNLPHVARLIEPLVKARQMTTCSFTKL